MPYMIKKVCFATDFSELSMKALPFAADFAQKHGAQLHVLHANVLHRMEPHLEEHIKAEFEKVMLQIKHQCGEVMLPMVVCTEKRGTGVASTIVEYIQDANIDMIFLGTHGRTGLVSTFLGSVAREVMRISHCPVLTIKEGARSTTRIKKILVPVDFSTHSIDAISHAKAFSELYDADIHLLHVIEQRPTPYFYPEHLTTEEAFPELNSECVSAINHLANRARLVEANIHVCNGIPEEEICDFASVNNMDIIITATHGLSGLKRRLLGSVTELITQKSPVPVLTIRSSELLEYLNKDADTREGATLF